MRVDIRIPILIAMVFVLSACGSASSSDPQSGGGDMVAARAPNAGAPAVSAQGLAAESLAAGYIPSTAALNPMGEEVTIRGLIADYQYHGNKPGKPTLLLFDVAGLPNRKSDVEGLETPNTFATVILRKIQSDLPPNFGPLWDGKVLCVTGTIEDYQGSPAIIVSEGTDIVAEC